MLRNETLPALLARHPGGKHAARLGRGLFQRRRGLFAGHRVQGGHRETPARGRFTLQIYATDLDADAIDQARKGVYPDNIAADVSPERLARHFVPEEGGGYRIGKDIREMVVFAPQNIIADPPFTKLDILTCRNLLIYFGAQLQKKLLPLFYYALNRDGILLLGSAETTGNFGHLFAPVNTKARLFRRLDQALPMADIEFPGRLNTEAQTAVEAPPVERAENLGQLTDQLIQQSWAPPAVLVNADGDILYISGRTGKYLEPAAGKTNINLHAMARDGLREALTGVVRKALKDPQPVHLNGLRVGTNGGTQIVDVVVQAIDKPEALRGRVLIVFKDVVSPPPRRKPARAWPTTGTRHWCRNCTRRARRCRSPTRKCRPRSRSSSRATRSCNRPTRNCNPPTRN
jgi:hypothetical protein